MAHTGNGRRAWSKYHVASFILWYKSHVLYKQNYTISVNMDLGELQLASKCICENEHLSPKETILCKRIKGLTKERDELISEERELEMTIKERKEIGKNCIKARVKSILNHPCPKAIANKLTPLNTLEKKKRNVSASLTVLGRQLVTLDQQIIDLRDESLARGLDKKEAELRTRQKSIDSTNESICEMRVQLVH